ncbi:V4R domain-containing protein [Aneurinibacillus tyrosinisolvens]|uniref:V4R domain-containing protein n=1 Tax=Aneurinibacillus tyrosinisolvens TaxID=1443435 RepID=UPI00063EDC6B|nr:V4R domain-containing protein [Aneurinibacillus tyrosinisolvens]
MLHFEGYWKNSYEAQEHVKLFGHSDYPICNTLIGYASGYLSTVMGKKVIVKEIQCQGMGDTHCHWIGKTIEEWQEDISEELKYYEVNNIIDELDQTYKKLKVERDNLNKAYGVHQKLMKEILREHDLTSIANVLYQITNMPVIIEDRGLNVISCGGITLREAQNFSEEIKQHRAINHSTSISHMEKTILLELSSTHRRIISPIYLRQKIVGYCSFLYKQESLQEVDKMVLEHATMACSLYLLNERTRIHTEQRMRGSLLEDILSKQITLDEVIKRAHHIDFHVHGSGFFMIAFNRLSNHKTIEEELEFNDQLITGIATFFKKRNMNVLVGQKSGNVIVLLSENEELQEQAKKEELCRTLIRYCMRKHSKCQFKLGISSTSRFIEDALNLYEESMACLRIAVQNQDIVFFDNLGIVGILFQTRDSDTLHKFAYKTLGNLIKEDKFKNMELTKTLYHYLNNSCNVHKTARTMNFSVSGLRYRLQRLNQILQLDFSETHIGHQIYLALQSLIVLGELSIED